MVTAFYGLQYTLLLFIILFRLFHIFEGTAHEVSLCTKRLLYILFITMNVMGGIAVVIYTGAHGTIWAIIMIIIPANWFKHLLKLLSENVWENATEYVSRYGWKHCKHQILYHTQSNLHQPQIHPLKGVQLNLLKKCLFI
eukprot:916965_1